MTETPGSENKGFWKAFRENVKEGVRDGLRGSVSDATKFVLKWMLLFILVIILGALGYNLIEDEPTTTAQPPAATQAVNSINVNPVNASAGSVPVTAVCPSFSDGFLMPYANVAYGDPMGNGYGYTIGHYPDGSFETWNPFTEEWLVYPAAYSRNIWIPLTGSGFTICVDSNNNAYARFTG